VAPDHPMSRVGPYPLGRRLGAGATGQVWTAVAPGGARLAIKVVGAGAVPAALWARELTALARLDHPQIAAILDHGTITDDDVVPGASVGDRWLAMARLEADLATRPPETWQAFADALRDVAAALAHAHARGVLHLDVKPNNLLWSGTSAVLADFGIAALRDGGGVWRARGTPAFAAPEQVEGRPSVAADLFGLGATAWAWLTGHGPYEQATADATRRAALAGEPHPLPADVPPAVAALLHALVRPDPGDRPSMAADVDAALARLAWPSGPLPSAPPAGASPAPLAGAATFSWDAVDAAPDPAGVTAASVPPAPFAARRPDDDPRHTPRQGANLALLGLRTLPLVGREDARDALWAALAEVVATQRLRVVVVDGPPGSGVDRLVGWLAERVIEVGAAWVQRGTTPIGALSAADRPTVWIDGDRDAAALADLAARRASGGRRGLPLLLVCARAQARPGDRAIALGPLSSDEVRRLVAFALHTTEEARAAIVDAARGWPGFAVDLLGHWARGGALRVEAGRYTLREPLPPLPADWAALHRDELAQALARRPDLLPVLALLADAPAPLAVDELTAAADRWGHPLAADAVEAASALGWVRVQAGRIALTNPARVAAVRALPAVDASTAARARAMAEVARDPEQAGRAWLRAGDPAAAAAVLPPGDALERALIALGVPPDDPRRLDCVVKRAARRFGVGDLVGARTELDEIAPLLTDALRPRWLAGRANVAMAEAQWDAAERWVAEAWALAPHATDVRGSWARLAGNWRAPPGALAVICGWIPEIPPDKQAMFLRLAWRVAYVTGQNAAADALLDQVEALDPGSSWNAMFRGVQRGRAGDLAGAIRALDRAAAGQRDAGNAFGVAVALRFQVHLWLDAGETDRAREAFDELLQIEQTWGIPNAHTDDLARELADLPGVDPFGAAAAALPDLAGFAPIRAQLATGDFGDHSPRRLAARAAALGARHPAAAREALALCVAWDVHTGDARVARWRAWLAALDAPI
jgi:hypothetical protein